MDRGLWNVFVPEGNRKICRQTVLAVFAFFLLPPPVETAGNAFHGALPQITSLLGCSPSERGKMDFWSIPEPLERRALKEKLKGAVGDLLGSFGFSRGRRVSHPGKTPCSTQICSFLKNVEDCLVQGTAMLWTQCLLRKNCAFGIPVFLKQVHICTQQSGLCNYHPQTCLHNHKMLHPPGCSLMQKWTEREIQLRLQFGQIFHLTTDLST